MNAALSLPTPAYSAVTSRGFGREAIALNKEIESVAKHLDKAHAVSHNRREALRRVDEAWAEFSAEDADQAAVAAASVHFAKAFLRVLPDHVAAPEVDFLLNGEIVFEWITATKKRLLLSFSSVGEVNFASICPSGESKGRQYFAGVIPDEISLALGRVLG